MKNTKQFIEDAIEGGWKPEEWFDLKHFIVTVDDKCGFLLKRGATEIDGAVQIILLDPLAWQAVGKTRGWCSGEYSQPEGTCVDCGEVGARCLHWGYVWHKFIDHLADGKDIDQALGVIE